MERRPDYVDGITIRNAGAFEFAFENYVALGYGDEVRSARAGA